ncbi:MAG: hypothetical protein HFF75_01355 [Oscillospiraceae bacterium]|jgi:uncharacterized protein YxeA|nr:hypothetical protein [Oscillospiraceae bacterium]
METKSKANQKWIVILLAALIVMLGVILAVVLLRGRSIPDGNTPLIGYSADAKVMLDQNSLQAAYDQAAKNAAEGAIGLKYQNDAYSSNGEDFTCRILNSSSNIYDMFLTIYADAEMTDQIFLSGLVPPGSGFENITLDRVLEKGDHMVYVVLTQVETNAETGEQVIKNQVAHTMDFHVTEE